MPVAKAIFWGVHQFVIKQQSLIRCRGGLLGGVPLYYGGRPLQSICLVTRMGGVGIYKVNKMCITFGICYK